MTVDHAMGNNAEDAKIVTLARATRTRTNAAEGAAVRDTTGRTYAASSVALRSLSLSALEAAVAMAVSSGATGLEAAAVATDRQAHEIAVGAVREFAGDDVPIFVATYSGEVVATI